MPVAAAILLIKRPGPNICSDLLSSRPFHQPDPGDHKDHFTSARQFNHRPAHDAHRHFCVGKGFASLSPTREFGEYLQSGLAVVKGDSAPFKDHQQ